MGESQLELREEGRLQGRHQYRVGHPESKVGQK